MSRKILAILGAVILLISLTACSSAADRTTEAPTKKQSSSSVPAEKTETTAPAASTQEPVTNEPATAAPTEPTTEEPVTEAPTEPPTTVSAETYMEQGRQYEEEALQKAETAWKEKSVPSVDQMVLFQCLSPETMLTWGDQMLREEILGEEEYICYMAFLPDTVRLDRTLLESALAAYRNALSAGGSAEASQAIERVEATLSAECPARCEMTYQYSDSDIHQYTAEYSYYESGLPEQVRIEKVGEQGCLLFSFAFDEEGRETSFAISNSDEEVWYVRRTTYDADGNITALTVGTPDDWDAIVSFEWTYDSEGRLETARPAADSAEMFGDMMFSFQWAGRTLTEVNVESSYEKKRAVLSYNKINIMSVGADVYAGDKLEGSATLLNIYFTGADVYCYSLVNGMLMSSYESRLIYYTYDEDGAVIRTEDRISGDSGTETTLCDYDLYGRLTRYSTENRHGGDVDALSLEYRYDEFGRRTEAIYWENDMPVATFSYSY